METTGASICAALALAAILNAGARAGEAVSYQRGSFSEEELATGRSAVRTYLAADEQTARDQAIARIAALGWRAVSGFEELLGLDERRLPPEPAEVGDVFPVEGLEGSMFVRVPAEDASMPALRPLLVALLPSQLDDGQAIDALDTLFGDSCTQSGWVLAAIRPFRLDDDYTFRKDKTRPSFQPWHRGSAELVPYAISYLMRMLPIDPDRVHLVGFGDGGDGALWAGARYTDRLASVVVIDGSLTGRNPTRWVANLSTVPVMLVHGLVDRPETSDRVALARLIEDAGVQLTRMSLAELASFGLGRSIAMEEDAPFPAERLLAWLDPVRRSMVDRELRRFTDRPGYGAFQWLDIEACDSRTTVRIEADRARSKDFVATPNRIVLEHQSGLQAFSLWVDPQLFDPRRPLVVEHDGRRLFEGDVLPQSVETAVATLLLCWQQKGDPTRLYSRRLSFDLR